MPDEYYLKRNKGSEQMQEMLDQVTEADIEYQRQKIEAMKNE